MTRDLNAVFGYRDAFEKVLQRFNKSPLFRIAINKIISGILSPNYITLH